MSNNFGTALVKILALTSGAVLGTLLARWFEEKLTNQAIEKSDYDKTRYSQGLAPLAPQPQPQIHELPPVEEQQY